MLESSSLIFVSYFLRPNEGLLSLSFTYTTRSDDEFFSFRIARSDFVVFFTIF